VQRNIELGLLRMLQFVDAPLYTTDAFLQNLGLSTLLAVGILAIVGSIGSFTLPTNGLSSIASLVIAQNMIKGWNER
jgi:hypothetical protein